MSKSISTFADDVYALLDPGVEHEHTGELAVEHATNIGAQFSYAIEKIERPRVKGKMWASDTGKQCLRQMWYKFNTPEEGEPLMGHTRFKFLYGNLIEDAVLYLGKEAGHDVSGEQELVETAVKGWSVRGKIDAIIDGYTVDVKSTSSFGFQKYAKEGITEANDSFGYLEQVSFYHAFGPETKGAGFLFVDKQNGHIKWQEIEPYTKEEMIERIEERIIAIEQGNEFNAPKAYADVPDGKSGNRKLGIGCSYCEFKERCWPGLRSFAYSNGPKFLTEVKNLPRVPEITKR